MIRKVLGSILMVSVFLAYGIGPALSLEIEHHHHVDDHHEHADMDFVLAHHNDHSHHEPADSPGEEPDGEEESPVGSSHSHCVCLAGETFAEPVGDAWNNLCSVSNGTLELPAGETCPDGPSFDLIKPPQLV
jgi:hypothetical protein